MTPVFGRSGNATVVNHWSAMSNPSATSERTAIPQGAWTLVWVLLAVASVIRRVAGGGTWAAAAWAVWGVAAIAYGVALAQLLVLRRPGSKASAAFSGVAVGAGAVLLIQI